MSNSREETPLTSDNKEYDFDIAVIGMSGRFPGADSVNEFWQNLCSGVESISFFSDEELKGEGLEPALLNDPNYVKASPVLKDPALFDASFFGYSPREAQLMDPQQRLFLECAWEALEHAGYNVDTYEGPIGVYAGTSINSYLLFSGILSNFSTELPLSITIGSDKDYLTTRVSYKLNLKGPSVTVQSACSTSLVAVHVACQSLLNAECDMALAGGVSIRVPHRVGYLYQEESIYSPDGHCRAFDARAQGTIFGSGLGIVVLKRLSEAIVDKDCIYAVIKGSAINNDGSSKFAYTAPSVNGQLEVILQAQANAGIGADTLTYIETHGTGTALGDPIEIAALTQAFRAHTPKNGFCAIGSVKSNIGHLDAASGVASLIKTVLALKHKLIPPSLHFEEANPKIDFENSPFYVNTTLSNWESQPYPRRAGVTSLGVGGTNVHLILEEAPPVERSEASNTWQLLPLSAKTSAALDTATTNLAEYLKQQPDLNLADVAYTLQTGRKVFNHRRIVVCQNLNEAVTRLERLDPKWVKTADQEPLKREIVFMFPGQGAQYVNMGLDLYKNAPEFQAEVDRCSEILQPHLGFDLRKTLYPGEEANLEEANEKLTQTAVAQPTLFVIAYALAMCCLSWELEPVALIGHSIGEYVAACLAGVFSLKDALALVAARGRLMQTLPAGSMLAVSLSEAELQPFLGDKLSLAVINTPSMCVVAGEKADIEVLEKQLAAQNISCRLLHTSHAFHSKMMEPILEAFTAQVAQVPLNPPQIPFVSNVTGTWITPAEATDPAYWAAHLRQTVRFAEGLQTLLAEPNRLFLELGPGQTLSSFVKQHPDKSENHLVLPSMRHPKEQKSDEAVILDTLGQLWLGGVQINWSKLHADDRCRRVSLPTYPFERKQYWFDGGKRVYAASTLLDVGEALVSTPNSNGTYKQPRIDQLREGASRDEVERSLAKIWREVLGADQVGAGDNFFELGGNSLMAVDLFIKINKVFGKKLPLATLIEAPTVAQLAQVLHQEARPEAWNSLVTLQSGGSKMPFFCVHAEGGNVIGYRSLAHYLGQDYPFYGLQAQGLAGEVYGISRFEEMATHYLEEVRKVQPKGPYYLGGWCLGADIAFEMAQQLRAQNEAVALVVMIQSRRPGYFKRLSEATQLQRWRYRLMSRMDYEWYRLTGRSLPGKVAYLWQRFNRGVVKTQFMLETKLDSPLSRFKAHSRIYMLEALAAAHNQGYENYQPAPYDGPVVIFRTTKQPAGIRPDPTLGWGEFMKGELQLYEIPGYHQTVLEEPFVQILAQQLRECLDRAQPGNNRVTVAQNELPKTFEVITADQAVSTGV